MPTQGFKGDLSVAGVIVGVAKETTLNIDADEIEVTQRQNDALKTWLPGQDDVSIDVSLGNDPTDPRWQEIRAAAVDKTPLTNVRVQDGEDSAHFFELSEAYAFGFGKEQAMDGEQVWNTTLRPGPNCVASFDFE